MNNSFLLIRNYLFPWWIISFIKWGENLPVEQQQFLIDMKNLLT